MICYRDMTFCHFHANCAGASECGRALTVEVQAAAVRWWGDNDPPIAQFASPPECYELKTKIREGKND